MCHRIGLIHSWAQMSNPNLDYPLICAANGELSAERLLKGDDP